MSTSSAPTDGSDATPVALVMFGLTGDLGEKKLFPALVELAREGLLRGPVIAVGRSEVDDDELWARLADAVGDVDDSLRAELDLHYHQGDSTEAGTYGEIDELVAELVGDPADLVVYTALPPDLFAGVAEGIAAAGLSDRTRLVVEKPFGHDAASAEELHRAITEHLDPERLFAVDHFLAKSAVENLLAFRTANPMIESSLRAPTVDRVELTMAEDFGVDGRGSFYDPVGAVRDVLQNHLLQTLAVLVMDPPSDDSSEAYDRARADLLEAVHPLAPDDVVLGQYEGYRKIDDVDSDSTTETFVAARFGVDNDRWRGVPMIVRSGKEMAASYTEAVIVFGEGSNNRLRFGLKPDTTISVDVDVLDPEHHGLRSTTMVACGPNDHGSLSDYATMLAGALAGEHRHFARIDDIVAAWDIVDGVLEAGITPLPYEKGSMGPAEADELVPGGFTGRRPVSRPGCA